MIRSADVACVACVMYIQQNIQTQAEATLERQLSAQRNSGGSLASRHRMGFLH